MVHTWPGWGRPRRVCLLSLQLAVKRVRGGENDAGKLWKGGPA